MSKETSEMKLEKLRHDNRMEELKYERDTNKIKQQLDLEVARIKSAEARKRIVSEFEHKKEFLRIKQGMR